MLVEDLSAFFADFSVVAQYGTLSGPVLLDAPEHDVLNGMATTRAYSMTYQAAQFSGLQHGDQIKIGDKNYSVIAVNSQDDGALRVATLQRS